jgi:hypothetical protein
MRAILATTAALGLLAAAGCSKKADGPLAPIPFSDDFERAELGANYRGDPAWRIRDGAVFSAGTRNRALWLEASLPDDAVIELDVRSDSPDGDIKFEIYADGKNHASGYILIFGGWKNTISAIARLDEHGADRQELNLRGQVQMGKTYHMKVVRKDKVLRWYVDGKLLLDYYDSEPLKGPGHDRFGFNNWEVNLSFDNLTIRPAGESDR